MTTRRRWQRIAAWVVLVTFTAGVTACGGAQSDTPATTTSTTPVPPTTIVPSTLPPAPPPTEPPTLPPSTLPAQPPAQLNKQELHDLVAPVALYPDVVLASLLPATTNPDQLHAAAEYVGAAQHVDTIPQDRGWDGSVIGLLQFPDVVRWLDQNPAWTDQMGQAVTYQQGDVLDAIQDYRHAVQNVGNLKSNRYQTVRKAANDDIRIEPARPDVVYVPSYDPVAAAQPQPAQESSGINPWLAFGGGALVGALGAWALYSIFDDDGNDHHDYNYYRGRRRIRAYDNYYYARGRRPAEVDWTPRPRPRQAASQGWQHPRRLDYQQVQAGKKPGRALRPPMTTSAQQAPKPGELRREQRQQRRALEQEQRRERQTQRQERTQQQREQRQERNQELQQQKQRKREEQEQRRQQRQEQQQEQRRQRQETEQERRQQQQQKRQERRQEQQGQQQERREQRQERQERRKEQRQEQQQQNPKKKKKDQQQP